MSQAGDLQSRWDRTTGGMCVGGVAAGVAESMALAVAPPGKAGGQAKVLGQLQKPRGSEGWWLSVRETAVKTRDNGQRWCVYDAEGRGQLTLRRCRALKLRKSSVLGACLG